ncbi:MAG: IS4 family transposase [Proteobacteria bacterium]|nr:IS4 family transposase [Pseudomonadota bacterium]
MCAELIDFLKKIISSQDFIKQHRQSPTNFIRQRKLPFSILIFFLINLIKGSYQDELDHFYKAIFSFDVARRIVTKAALAKARMKLKYEAFLDLNSHLIEYFYQNFRPQRWNGFTLLAIDGTTVQLPRIEAITKYFGAWNPRQGGKCPMARVSQMFDPLNQITVDAIIEPKETGERELAAFHFLKLMPKDLILLDRGYPAYWLFNLVISRGADFCARIQRKRWKIVRQFYNSGKTEKIISLPVFPSSRKQCKEMGLDPKPLKLRLIRVELDTGEAEILITSLLDTQTYPYEQFAELYHLRWPVEEDYKTMKQWIEIENFSGKSVLSVYQDFHAKVFSKNLTSALVYPTRSIIDTNTENSLYRYQRNFAQTLSKVRDVIPLLFLRSSEVLCKLISDIQAIIVKTIEPIRPGRKFPRNFNNRSGRFHYGYQPIR